MNSPIPEAVSPLQYDASYEVPEDGEAETCAELMTTLSRISETTYKDSGHAMRSVHAKSHGILRGELQVLSNLPSQLAQGIFAKPAAWPVVMRFSTVPGDILDDSVSTPRGVAIKLIGVEGSRLEGSEGDITQDFVLVNGPAFLAPNAKKFLGSLKLLATTTDKAPDLKKTLSAVLRGTEKVVETFGGESATLKSIGGHPETQILGETFYSQAPILLGIYMAKVSLAPTSANLRTLAGKPLKINGKPNGLRESVVDFFSANGGEWDLQIQLCTNLKEMPIEDASVPWPENISPYVSVARLTVQPQTAWSAARSAAVDDGMSFSPWHGVAAHRPIGSVMRVRKMAYEMSTKFRAERNGHSIDEPQNLDDFPD